MAATSRRFCPVAYQSALSTQEGTQSLLIDAQISLGIDNNLLVKLLS
jgi:hypothetical protein